MDVTQLQETLIEIVTTFVPRLVGVIAILFVAWIVAGWMGRRVADVVGKKIDVTLSRFFGSMVRYAVLAMAILGCLRVFGIETTSFAALIAAMGLAVGLALQGTLSNFSAGVMLLAFRPFKIGDVISTAGITAKVVNLGLFVTEFDTVDNRRIIVPNGAIFGSTIENISYHDTRRVDVSVGTDYPADIAHTRNVLVNAVSSLEGVHADPAPVAYLTELGGSSIDWSVRVWCDSADYWDVRERTTQTVKNALDAEGIGIPYPQLDVHLDGSLTQ